MINSTGYDESDDPGVEIPLSRKLLDIADAFAYDAEMSLFPRRCQLRREAERLRNLACDASSLEREIAWLTRRARDDDNPPYEDPQ